MALANYTDLKESVNKWLARGDMAGNAEDFITLGEAALNRELNPVEEDAILAGTTDSRVIDISSLNVVEPIALFLIDPADGDETELHPMTAGTFPYQATSDEPRFWSVDGTDIKFDCPLIEAYTFRFRYRERFTLSESNPTNWLLTNHPDVYLAATLVWGGVFRRNSQDMTTWSTILATGIRSVRNIIAQRKRAVATVDSALRIIGNRSTYNYLSGDE